MSSPLEATVHNRTRRHLQAIAHSTSQPTTQPEPEAAPRSVWLTGQVCSREQRRHRYLHALPAVLVFDADGVATEVDGLDRGGTDAGHGVEYEVAGVGVGGDQVAGDAGQHLAGVCLGRAGRGQP